MTSLYNRTLTQLSVVLNRFKSGPKTAAPLLGLPRVDTAMPGVSDAGNIKFGACMRPSMPSVSDSGRIKFGACMRPSLPSIADASRIKFGAGFRPASR